MGKGIYRSNMSCWQRRKAGLKQDNAGPSVIDSESTKPEEVSVEVDEVEKPTETVTEVVEPQGAVLGEVVTPQSSSVDDILEEDIIKESKSKSKKGFFGRKKK